MASEEILPNKDSVEKGTHKGKGKGSGTGQGKGRGEGKGKSKGKGKGKGTGNLNGAGKAPLMPRGLSRMERWTSGRFLDSAFKAGRRLFAKNPHLRTFSGFFSVLTKRSKAILPAALLGPGSSLPVFLTSTLFLSILFTLLLVTITILYLHYRHATSDSMRIKELRAFRSKLRDKLVRLNCSPLMLRLAWSDSATYDKAIKQWPHCGGATGSIRFERETRATANVGLEKAIDILQETKAGYKMVSWADAIQMAGQLAVEVTGGPIVSIRYGRTDAPEVSFRAEDGAAAASAMTSSVAPGAPPASTVSSNRSKISARGKASGCPVLLSTRLPLALPPFPDHSPSADVHIRNVFYRMGYSNRDIVALCGAHTIGRAFQDRSGVCPNTSGDQGATIYTRPTSIAKVPENAFGGFRDKIFLSFFITSLLHIFRRMMDQRASVCPVAAAGPKTGCSLTTRTFSVKRARPTFCGFRRTAPSATAPSSSPSFKSMPRTSRPSVLTMPRRIKR